MAADYMDTYAIASTHTHTCMCVRVSANYPSLAYPCYRGPNLNCKLINNWRIKINKLTR